ncbi:hypothetical protein CAOG_03405 [Capsaspora owczarzaki ATCC 30864]|nr:hypothetical protein CAOG_03405 [Capsaspora owczarzaki ATCC 30864]|eukprot:XP_004364244.2 hypothetical protein CAOG_03405 [Capsaspora owczarzaki ATCC 30864]
MYKPTFADGRLSLAFHELDDVPAKVAAKWAPKTKELDVSHNNLRDLRSLELFRDIHTLVLDDNKLPARIKFPIFPLLKTLWINKNNIANLAEFIEGASASFPELEYLSMMNNPAAPSFFNGGTVEQYNDYRLFVISHFPQLKTLDDTPISDQERASAKKVYARVASMTKLMRTSSKPVLAKDRDADTFSLIGS